MFVGIRTLTMPCGCAAWRWGGTGGTRRCPAHQVEHHEQDTVLSTDGETLFLVEMCDCVNCRALVHGLDPYDYLDGLHLLARKEFERLTAPKEPTSTAGNPLPEGHEEKDPRCACTWAWSKGEWHLARLCADHAEKKDKRERERERNERGF